MSSIMTSVAEENMYTLKVGLTTLVIVEYNNVKYYWKNKWQQASIVISNNSSFQVNYFIKH